MTEKREPNVRGLALMGVAGILTIILFIHDPGSWQMWCMLGMVFVGFCHLIASLYHHGKWLQEQKQVDDAN